MSPLDLAERSRAHSADAKNVWATLRVCRRVVKRVVCSCCASLAVSVSSRCVMAGEHARDRMLRVLDRVARSRRAPNPGRAGSHAGMRGLGHSCATSFPPKHLGLLTQRDHFAPAPP
jgi:hypothetical protein